MEQNNLVLLLLRPTGMERYPLLNLHPFVLILRRKKPKVLEILAHRAQSHKLENHWRSLAFEKSQMHALPSSTRQEK